MPPKINIDAQVVLLNAIIEDKSGHPNWERIGEKIGLTAAAARLRYARIKAELAKETNEKLQSLSDSTKSSPTKKRKSRIGTASVEELTPGPIKMRTKRSIETATPKNVGQTRLDVKKEITSLVLDEEDY